MEESLNSGSEGYGVSKRTCAWGVNCVRRRRYRLYMWSVCLRLV